MKYSVLKILTWAIFVFGFVTVSVHAEERRLALVIGAADYTHISALKNTVNDSRMIADRLVKLNFEVTLVQNPDLISLQAKVREFAFKAEVADVALVYYAGHGIEIAGVNYLIPTDINVNDRSGIVTNSVSLDDILLSVDKARQLRIVILDSCRNDPFFEGANQSDIKVEDTAVRRSGLASPTPERGTLVAFAAEAGQVALDGAGNNSPFALALAEHLSTPELEIGLAFRRIRDSVLVATNNTQEPHTYGSMPGKPYFFAGKNQTSNVLANAERKNAWANLAPDQEILLQAQADGGDARSMLGLAYMRLSQESDKYDPKRAVELLEKAAQSGDPEAMHELGKLYEKGIGTAQDTAKAVELYRQSADANFADALNDLGFLHFQGATNVKRDKKLAIEYFGRAADLRQSEALFNYAALIDDGIVPGKNAKDAGKYLYDALRSGAQEVLNQLVKNPKMFKKATRLELQRHLASNKLYDGALDGQFGPGTNKGLKRAFGLKPE